MNAIASRYLTLQFTSHHQRNAGDAAIRASALLLVALSGCLPKKPLICAAFDGEISERVGALGIV